ncbi:Acg family FMN-binding oxidoreductase [Actinokineospora sp. NPDC004072]
MSVSSPWPGHDPLMSVIALANRAPSVHNTQPWRWLVGTRSLHLMADRARWLPATDPHGRDLVISCGAALHHLRVALAARGWSAVDLPVGPEDDDHLAALGLRPCPPAGADLAAAIPLRRTDRRRYSARPVPDRAVAALVRAAARLGVAAIPLVGEEERLEVAVSLLAGAARQRVDTQVRRELVHWTGRARGVPEGVAAANSPSGAVRHGGLPMRYFPGGLLTEPPGDPGGPDAGMLLVLATAGDARAARLRAGEAASAVLLTATALGLATCVLSQNVEVDGVRARLRDRLLAGRGEPQLVIRVGCAPGSTDPLPATARRPVAEVCHRLPGASTRPSW